MSRADREKSLYLIRLNQIKEELKQAYPDEFKQLNKANGKENESHSERDGFNYQMHGATALNVIQEKMQEEQASQDEDEEDKTLSQTFTITPEKDQVKKVHAPATSAEEIDRVTAEIFKKFEKSPDQNQKSIFSHDFLSNNSEEVKQHMI